MLQLLEFTKNIAHNENEPVEQSSSPRNNSKNHESVNQTRSRSTATTTPPKQTKKTEKISENKRMDTLRRSRSVTHSSIQPKSFQVLY